MTAGLRIEVATIDDLAALVTLKDACLAHLLATGIDQWDEQYPTATHIANDLSDQTLWAGWLGDDLIACMTMDGKYDPKWASIAWDPAGAPAIVVHRLMVHPARQGQGWAKRMMDHAQQVAVAADRRSIRLDCYSLNPASLRLYRSLGYQERGSAELRKGRFIGFERRLHQPTDDAGTAER